MPQQFVDPLAKDAGVADPAAKDYEAPSIAGDFGKGVKQGIHSAKGAGYGLIALVGDATGAEGVKNYGLQGAMRESAAAEETAPSVSRIEDVNSVGDFAHYAAGGVGSLVPFAATSAAGGGIGGLGARMLGRKAAERMVEQAIASGSSAAPPRRWPAQRPPRRSSAARSAVPRRRRSAPSRASSKGRRTRKRARPRRVRRRATAWLRAWWT
jgi:hypothetical protein